MANFRGPAICPYCANDLGGGLSGRDFNRDHILAKQFFPKPIPSDMGPNLVNACKPCNTSFKRDEEYMVAHLAAHARAKGGSGEAVFDQLVTNGAKNPGPLKAVERGFERIPLLALDGSYAGVKAVFRTDLARFDAVVGKWVRGFYFRALHRGLPPEVEMQILMFDVGAEVDHYPNAKAGSPRWPGKFEFEYSVSADDAEASRWAFTLWGSLGIYVATKVPLHIPVAGVIKDADGVAYLPVDIADRVG